MNWIFCSVFGCIALMLSGCMTLTSDISKSHEGHMKHVPGTKVADVIYDNGDIQSAAKIYYRLLQKDTENVYLWRRYSDALYMLEAYPEALEAYENLHKLSLDSCT
ncbi:MAG: hypothetical protein COB29_15945, partial [Sulfitobacter sp.]